MKSNTVQEFKETEIGKIPVDWKLMFVEDIAESISKTHSFNKEHLIFLNTSDIKSGKFLHQNYTPIKNFPGQAKKSIQKNDILFSEIRPRNGRSAFVDFDSDDYVVSTKLLVIRTKNELILPQYLYQFLISRHTINYLQRIAETRSGTFPQITFDEVSLLKIPLPSIDEQIRITELLSNLENKLSNLQNQNKVLEKITKSIFKSWFVDFDGIKEFDDSELGKIPKGWHVCNVEDFLSSEKGSIKIGPFGSQIKREYFVPEGFKVYGQENVKTKNFLIGYRYITEDRFNKLSSCELKSGEIVISMMGCIGNIAIVSKNIEKGIMDSHLLRLRIDRKKANSKFLFYYLESPSIQQQIELFSVGTIMAGLNSKIIKQLKFLNPGIQLQEKFDHCISSFYDKIFENNYQIDVLSKIRDSILPKLMSGEIRV